MQFSVPNLSDKEAENLQKAVVANQLASGPFVTEFEERIKEKFGYSHAVAVNSGTSALMLALEVLGVGEGDEVIVSPYTMVASVNVVLARGATPVFADIDRETYNLTPSSVAGALTRKTAAVIPVDIFGVPCDVKGIRQILPKNVAIVQDACEALGSTHDGKPVGFYADAAVFSFFPNKQITTGDGGVLVTADPILAIQTRALSRHGVLAGASMYEQSYGYNYRMSDLHAAVGCAQMERFDEIMEGKAAAYKLLEERFKPYQRQTVLEGDTYNPFVYVIELPEGVDKKVLCETAPYPLKPYFVSLHHLEHLQDYQTGPLPVCEEVARKTVALPYHHLLTKEEVEELWHFFKGVLQHAS